MIVHTLYGCEWTCALHTHGKKVCAEQTVDSCFRLVGPHPRHVCMAALLGLDLHTLGRPEQLWFQNNNIHPPQTTQAYLGKTPPPSCTCTYTSLLQVHTYMYVYVSSSLSPQPLLWLENRRLILSSDEVPLFMTNPSRYKASPKYYLFEDVFAVVQVCPYYLSLITIPTSQRFFKWRGKNPPTKR